MRRGGARGLWGNFPLNPPPFPDVEDVYTVHGRVSEKSMEKKRKESKPENDIIRIDIHDGIERRREPFE